METLRLDSPNTQPAQQSAAPPPVSQQKTIPQKPKLINKIVKQKTPQISYRRDENEIFVKSYRGLFKNIGSSEIISIEINPSELRILYLRKFKKKYRIERWVEDSFDDPNINKIQTIVNRLQNFLDKSTIKRSQIVLTLFSPEVNIRTLTVPKLSGKELHEAVFWKNKNEVVNFSENSLWDFTVVGETLENKNEVLRILTIIAQDNFVNKYLTILSEIGIAPNSVLVKPIALTSAFKKLTNEWALENRNTVLVEVGRETTLVCFYRAGALEFVRTLLFGSNQIDKSLDQPIQFRDKKIKMNSAKIDRFKKRHGILTALLFGKDKSYFPYNYLFKFMLPVLQMFVSELNRSIAFYKNSYDVDKINAMFMTGSGCNLKNFNIFLSSKLKIPVFLIAPSFPSIRTDSYLPGYDYTSCFGAATYNSEKFNFIPRESRIKKRFKFATRLLMFFSFLILSALGYYTYTSKIIEYSSQNHGQISILEKQYNALLPGQQRYDEIINQINGVMEKKKDIANTLKINNKTVDILKMMSSLIPDEVVLISVNYLDKGSSAIYGVKQEKEGLVIIQGMVYKNFVSADIILIDFINRIKELNYFKDIKITDKTKQIENQIFTFEINLILK